PLTPPVQLVESSLLVASDFGGFSVNFTNEKQADVVIEMLQKSDGEWTELDAYYTNSKAGLFSVRGLAAEPSEFGFTVRDRWRNRSDTLVVELTPLYEVELAAPTPITILPGDYNLHYNNFHYGYMFDGIVSPGNYMGTLLTATSNLPLSFTLDFGRPTKFSRFRYWMPQSDATIFNYASAE